MPRNRTITGELFQVPRSFTPTRAPLGPHTFRKCPRCGLSVQVVTATGKAVAHEHPEDRGRLRRRVCFG